MHPIRTFVTRAIVVAAVALTAALVERPNTLARAEPSPSKSAEPVPTDKPERVKPARTDIISDCTKAAYVALDTELAGLRAVHGEGTHALAEAYAKRKEALVGEKALAKKGCEPAREDK